MPRRQQGSGSIYHDGTSWVAAVSVTTDAGRRRKKFRRPTREGAETALTEWLAANPRTGPTMDGRAVAMVRARAIGTHTSAEWWAKVRTYGGRCHYCHRPWGRGLHKDHMTPVSRGGSDLIDNLVPACAECNLSKSTQTAGEFIAWAARIGFFDRPRPRDEPRPSPLKVIAFDDGTFYYPALGQVFAEPLL